MMNHPLLQSLQKKLSADRILTGSQLEGRYHHIWTMDQAVAAPVVVLPRNTEEVSLILKECQAAGQTIIIHGGLTNLVGATHTKSTDWVLSLEKMNEIEEVDANGRSISVQAGVILEDIQRAAAEEGLLFPLNFGAKGSAQIGGIIASNAGGLRVFRFGMTRQLVLGLEVVLPDGTILSDLKKIIKNNSGYDLKQLFIGAEGTLGVITRAVLKVVEAPSSRQSVFAAVNSYPQVVQLLKFMDQKLAGTLSGFELIWGNSYRTMTSPPALSKPPLPHGYPYYILLESLGGAPPDDAIRLQEYLEQALVSEIIEDAVFASSEADLNWFWRIREDVHVLASQCPNDHHFDISLPTPLIGENVAKITEKLQALPEVSQVFAFGHVADGNIHFIIGKDDNSLELKKQIDDIVYAPLQALGGSVSAEHGIGIDKKAYLGISNSPAAIELMKTLKRTLDPANILNPGRIIDLE
ncbi:MAG: FAD-binding oxidoreductase [Bacteroidota bacterium]